MVALDVVPAPKVLINYRGDRSLKNKKCKTMKQVQCKNIKIAKGKLASQGKLQVRQGV